jgi:Bacterial mobilisation protein (MobC)
MTDPIPPALEAKAKRKRPSGSEKRKREWRVTPRLTEAERAQLEQAADRAGLSVSAYVRAQSLAEPVTRARRSPPVNRVALAQLLGHINHIGSNVNQIARQLNSGRDPEEIMELAAAVRAVWHMREAVLIALGMQDRALSKPDFAEPL